jgi:hypothetical protein
MELLIDVRTTDCIMEKADRIGALSEIIDTLNHAEEELPEAGRFISHLLQIIQESSKEIISTIQQVMAEEIPKAHVRSLRAVKSQ